MTVGAFVMCDGVGPGGWVLEVGLGGWRAAIWPIAGDRPPLRMTVVDPRGVCRAASSGRRSVAEAVEAALTFVAGSGVAVGARGPFLAEAAKLDARLA